MLSSTADNLFWMARSIERAENTARMLDVTYSMSLVSQATVDPYQNWTAMLSINGLHDQFFERYKELNPDNLLNFMMLDELNPSSIIIPPTAALTSRPPVPMPCVMPSPARAR